MTITPKHFHLFLTICSAALFHISFNAADGTPVEWMMFALFFQVGVVNQLGQNLEGS